MDRPRALCWLVVSGILVELVCGAPFFFSLPQRDCDQPPSYPYESYQQPGPSYEETLQQMVQDTLVALRDIVYVTAQVTRQELQALAKDLYSKVQRNCATGSAEDEDQINSDDGQSIVILQGGHEENNPMQNGYHYNYPNKKINMFATENTIPNSHDTDRNEIENNILNKQTFENEISTEEAIKFSETSTKEATKVSETSTEAANRFSETSTEDSNRFSETSTEDSNRFSETSTEDSNRFSETSTSVIETTFTDEEITTELVVTSNVTTS